MLVRPTVLEPENSCARYQPHRRSLASKLWRKAIADRGDARMRRKGPDLAAWTSVPLRPRRHPLLGAVARMLERTVSPVEDAPQGRLSDALTALTVMCETRTKRRRSRKSGASICGGPPGPNGSGRALQGLLRAIVPFRRVRLEAADLPA